MASEDSSKPTTRFTLIVRLCFILLAVAVPLIAADTDFLRDFCAPDFADSIRVFAGKYPVTTNTHGFIMHSFSQRGNTSATPVNATATFVIVHEFPGLDTLGLGMVRLDFGVGGLIPPHTHTHGSEIIFVLEGSLYAGFVNTNDALCAQVINKGDVMIIPRGLIHFQINVGEGLATAIIALNSQDAAEFQQTANSKFGCDGADEKTRSGSAKCDDPLEKARLGGAKRLKYIFSGI